MTVGYCEFKREARNAFAHLCEEDKQLILGHFQFVQRNSVPTGALVIGPEGQCYAQPSMATLECATPKKEKNMNLNIEQTHTRNLEAESRDHFNVQIMDHYSQRHYDLRKEYGLDNDPAPTTPEELIERITKGHYILPEKNKRNPYHSRLDHFIWRDPKVEKDEEGFEKAMDKLRKARDEAVNALMSTLDVEGFAKALKRFQEAKV